MVRRNRRSNLRRRRGGRPKSKYLRGGSGLIKMTKTLTAPDKIIVKLPYYDSFSYNGIVGQLQTFNLNSIYDPDRTGVGHQPLGYDQWATIYGRYRVIGAKVQVGLTNSGTTPVRFGIAGNNLQGVVIGSPQPWEWQHVKSRLVGNAGGMNTGQITKYFYLPRINGVSSATYKGSDRYQSLFGGNPSELLLGHVIVQKATAGTNADNVNVNFDVRITYYVELFDRVSLAISNTDPGFRGPSDNVLEPAQRPSDTASTKVVVLPLENP